LNEDLGNMESFLREHSGTELGDLAERMVGWPHLYSMFHTAFAVDNDLNFLGSLHGFLVNVFLDDTYYYISWRTPFTEEDRDGVEAYAVTTDSSGMLVTYESTRDNPLARPYVYLTGDGSASVSEMMEAMDEYERRSELRRKEVEELFGWDGD